MPSHEPLLAKSKVDVILVVGELIMHRAKMSWAGHQPFGMGVMFTSMYICQMIYKQDLTRILGSLQAFICTRIFSLLLYFAMEGPCPMLSIYYNLWV